jgi:hypothetical protein
MLNATGVWTGCNYQDTYKYTAGEAGQVFISVKDREVLRKLAESIAGLALKDKEKVKVDLWYKHNSMKPERPLIFCDPENGWNEIIIENMLDCKGLLARRWEVVLRKELFWGEEILDDKPIEANFKIGYTYTEDDWAGESKLITGGKEGGSYVWDAPIKNLKDLDKIKIPQIKIDYKTTQETIELAKDVFHDLLEVKLESIWWWSLGVTLDLVKLIGLSNMFMLFYDNPEFLHQVNHIIMEGYLKKLDFLEKNNLLFLNNKGTYVGSGGLGYTEELPAKDFDGTHVRLIDMWGFVESQESVSVSPAMFEEFIFKYQLPIIKKFGLSCYGCCESLESRWHIIKKIPNLRRVSVGPWADRKKMAQLLGDKYIFSMKPNPADIAVSQINKDYIGKEMEKDLEITKGCIVEIIMKDNHTLGKNPSNLTNWVRTVRKAIDKVYN